MIKKYLNCYYIEEKITTENGLTDNVKYSSLFTLSKTSGTRTLKLYGFSPGFLFLELTQIMLNIYFRHCYIIFINVFEYCLMGMFKL